MQTKRNPALDILRGLAVAIMIIVDAVPDTNVTPPLLMHSPWEGISIADLAFPGFVFTMGVSAVYSLQRHRDGLLLKILRRTLLLFAIGLMVNLIPAFFALLVQEGYTLSAFQESLREIRIPGILQRLALVYAFGTLLLLSLKTEGRILTAAVLLLVFSSLGFHLYAPDAPFDKMHNLSQAVDLMIPGAAHVYHDYGLPFDPEGLYGTPAATASMLFGAWAGRILQRTGPLDSGVPVLMIGSVILLSAGWLWSLIDIVSKPLWTAPFVLFNAGGAMLVLALLTRLPDPSSGPGLCLRPFYAFGRNPLVFFLMSNAALIFLFTLTVTEEQIPAYQWIWEHGVRGLVSLPFSAALHMVLWCLLWWLPAELLCRKGIIIKL